MEIETIQNEAQKKTNKNPEKKWTEYQGPVWQYQVV